MQQLKHQLDAEHKQEFTIEPPAQPRVLSAEEVIAVAGGPQIEGNY